MSYTFEALSESREALVIFFMVTATILLSILSTGVIHDRLPDTHVTGIVIKSDIIYLPQSPTADSIENYSLDVEFFYKVNNIGYKSNKYYHWDKPQKTRRALRKLIKEEYTLGQEVTVYYNPAAPATGTLVRIIDTLFWKGLVFIVFCAIIFWLVICSYLLVYVDSLAGLLFVGIPIILSIGILIYYVNYLLNFRVW